MCILIPPFFQLSVPILFSPIFPSFPYFLLLPRLDQLFNYFIYKRYFSSCSYYIQEEKLNYNIRLSRKNQKKLKIIFLLVLYLFAFFSFSVVLQCLFRFSAFTGCFQNRPNDCDTLYLCVNSCECIFCP